ncbi:MAG: hypothetical protein ACRCTD_10050 [Beijerinckiaceae bacterium]
MSVAAGTPATIPVSIFAMQMPPFLRRVMGIPTATSAHPGATPAQGWLMRRAGTSATGKKKQGCARDIPAVTRRLGYFVCPKMREPTNFSCRLTFPQKGTPIYGGKASGGQHAQQTHSPPVHPRCTESARSKYSCFMPIYRAMPVF